MEVSGQLHAQAALPPWKEAKVPTGGCEGPSADLDAVVKRKNPFTPPIGNRTQVVRPYGLNIPIYQIIRIPNSLVVLLAADKEHNYLRN
jgi:hypothetical protein